MDRIQFWYSAGISRPASVAHGLLNCGVRPCIDCCGLWRAKSATVALRAESAERARASTVRATASTD